MGWPGRASYALTQPSDVADVEAVARDYIEGWYEGDVEGMDRALHPDLVKLMPVDEDSLGAAGLRAVSRSRRARADRAGGR